MTTRSKRLLILVSVISIAFNAIAFACMANAKILLDTAVIMAKNDGMFIIYGSLLMIPVSLLVLITIARTEPIQR